MELHGCLANSWDVIVTTVCDHKTISTQMYTGVHVHVRNTILKFYTERMQFRTVWLQCTMKLGV